MTATVQPALDGSEMVAAAADELWAQVEQTEGCWIWKGRTFGKYGTLRVGRANVRVHRLSWQIANNAAIPVGLVVRHKCDVPLCVRPDHLELGTTSQNNRDTVQRNRRTRNGAPAGEQNPVAVLTAADVNEMRRAARSGVTITAIANAAGASYNTVHSAIRGHTWMSAAEPPVAPTRRKRKTHPPRLHEQEPGLYREALRLRDEGLSLQQIANQLGISRGAAFRWCRTENQGSGS